MQVRLIRITSLVEIVEMIEWATEIALQKNFSNHSSIP